MTSLSIVTINRNNLEGLKKTFHSISQQVALCELEWIVIDGNSGKETVNFLTSLESSVKWISESDCGIYDAMNKGLELVTRDFVWFLNSGDKAINLAELCNYLNKVNSFQITICNWKRDFGKSQMRKSKYLWTMYHSLPTRHQAIVYSVKSIGTFRYSPNFKIAGDFDFTAKIWAKNRKIFVRYPLTICEFESGGISSRDISTLVSEAWAIQRSILHVPKFVCGISKIIRLKIYYQHMIFLSRRKLWNRKRNPKN